MEQSWAEGLNFIHPSLCISCRVAGPLMSPGVKATGTPPPPPPLEKQHVHPHHKSYPHYHNHQSTNNGKTNAGTECECVHFSFLNQTQNKNCIKYNLRKADEYDLRNSNMWITLIRFNLECFSRPIWKKKKESLLFEQLCCPVALSKHFYDGERLRVVDRVGRTTCRKPFACNELANKMLAHAFSRLSAS